MPFGRVPFGRFQKYCFGTISAVNSDKRYLPPRRRVLCSVDRRAQRAQLGRGSFRTDLSTMFLPESCLRQGQVSGRNQRVVFTVFERREKTPTPKFSALLRKRPVLLRANFVLTKDRKRPYYRHFCGKMHREGSCSKAARGP